MVLSYFRFSWFFPSASTTLCVLLRVKQSKGAHEMVVVLSVLFEHSVHTCLHGTVLTYPYVSVFLQPPSFQWLWKEVIMKSLRVLYIP